MVSVLLIFSIVVCLPLVAARSDRAVEHWSRTYDTDQLQDNCTQTEGIFYQLCVNLNQRILPSYQKECLDRLTYIWGNAELVTKDNRYSWVYQDLSRAGLWNESTFFINITSFVHFTHKQIFQALQQLRAYEKSKNYQVYLVQTLRSFGTFIYLLRPQEWSIKYINSRNQVNVYVRFPSKDFIAASYSQMIQNLNTYAVTPITVRNLSSALVDAIVNERPGYLASLNPDLKGLTPEVTYNAVALILVTQIAEAITGRTPGMDDYFLGALKVLADDHNAGQFNFTTLFYSGLVTGSPEFNTQFGRNIVGGKVSLLTLPNVDFITAAISAMDKFPPDREQDITFGWAKHLPPFISA